MFQFFFSVFFTFCNTFRKILCVVCPQLFEKLQVCPDFKKFEKHCFKELVDLVFIRLIWENILSTAAEECGKTVIVVIKYDNRENFKSFRPVVLKLFCTIAPLQYSTYHHRPSPQQYKMTRSSNRFITINK